MKQSLRFTLLFLFLLPTLSYAQWTPLSSGTTRNLHDVFFVDRQTGWVSADSGLILRTTDGGASWQNSTAGFTHLGSLAFLNADTGYVMSGFSLPYVTYDGGVTWAEDTTIRLIGCFPERMRFNGRTLYLSYQGCFGGANLTTFDPVTKDTTSFFEFGPNPLNIAFRDIGFPSATQAIAMGEDNHIGRTFDSGDTWSTASPIDSILDWKAVDFMGSEGYAVTSDIFAPLYKSVDGGLTWAIDSAWSPTFFYPVATDVDYLSSGYGYVTANGAQGTQGLIFELRPGLFINYLQTPQLTQSIFMVDDSVGYVVGDSGMILKRAGGPLAVAAAHAALGFQLFPNPASETVAVRWDGPEAGELRIFATDGRLLHTQSLVGGQSSIDLSELPSGIFLVQLQSRGQVGTQRLAVQR